MDARGQIIQTYLGKQVHIVVDRPIGCHHGDMIYPVNYGYIPGVIAGDGEEQDVYILGIAEPISEFDGRIIGAVRRKNDLEDKLVAALPGAEYHQGQIMEAVYFQEQYFDSTVDALLRRSCGVIPYRRSGNGPEFLILLQTNGCWSFPKGHMEPFETEAETALRELREETGLSAALDPAVRAVSEYRISQLTRKQVILFPGEVRGNVVPSETEVRQYRWVSARDLAGYLYPDTWEAVRDTLSTIERKCADGGKGI